MLIGALTLVALLTAALSGMAGIGGGTILIAAMYASGLAPIVVVPVHAGVQLVSNGSRTLAYLRHVEWHALRDFLIGALPAPFLVAPLLARANPDWILILMAAFILASLWPAWAKRLRLEGRTGMITAGVLAGGVGSVVGASGTIIGPFFMRRDWSRETVIATLAVCQAAAHLLKVVAFGAYGFLALEHWTLLLPMCIAVVIGTLIGRGVGQRFSEQFFERLFRAVMGVLALKLAYDGIAGLAA